MGVSAKGIAEFFNLSGVSRAFDDLGSDAVARLAMNTDRISQSQSIINRAIGAMDDVQKQAYKELSKNLKGMDAGTAADQMEGFVKEVTNNPAFKKATADNKAFQEALDAYNKVSRDDGALKYFGRNEDENIRVIDKLNGLVSDPEYGSTRVKTGLAVAGGVAIGARVLSGGSVTRNARGEHDIVGVPFV